MNYFSLIAPLMVMTHFFESPFVVVGWDSCTEAMISRKDMGTESMDEFERCLEKKNYYRGKEVIRWDNRYRRYR